MLARPPVPSPSLPTEQAPLALFFVVLTAPLMLPLTFTSMSKLSLDLSSAAQLWALVVLRNWPSQQMAPPSSDGVCWSEKTGGPQRGSRRARAWSRLDPPAFSSHLASLRSPSW